MVLGLSEFSLRLPSAIMGTLMIPAIFLFVKEVLKEKYIALFSAAIMSLSIWQIEFSREVRWYQEFQFFYLLSVFFFYLGFIKGKNVFKVLSTIFIIMTPLLNSLGLSLIFLFAALFIYRGASGFFKRDSLTHFAVIAIALGAQLIHRTFFWKVGLSFYVSRIQSDNPVINALGKFFDSPKPFFTTTFFDMFPMMFLVFVSGMLIWLLSVFLPGMRNSRQLYLDLFGKTGWRSKFPFDSFFIYFLFFSNTFFLGVGNMYNQQRYIYFAFAYFVIGYCWTISEFSRLITSPFMPRARKAAYIVITAVLVFAAANHISPVAGLRIPFRQEGDRLEPAFAFSNTVSMHPDTKGAGVFIQKNMQEQDMVISMDLLNSYPYTRKMDHWLWSGSLVSWQPYHVIDGIHYDYYFGNKVLRDITDLFESLNENRDANVWIHANRSQYVEAHIDRQVSDFIESLEEYLVYTGKDGENRVYYLSSAKMQEMDFSLAESLRPSRQEVVLVQDLLYLDFSSEENDRYLGHGWSNREPEGRWASSREAIIFVRFEQLRDFLLEFQSMPLLDPEADQSADIYLEGELLGSIQYTDMALRTDSFPIPSDIIREDEDLALRFVFKYNRTPAELGISSEDARNLSVFFTFLRIK
jgi:hypothetical protein